MYEQSVSAGWHVSYGKELCICGYHMDRFSDVRPLVSVMSLHDKAYTCAIGEI